MKRLSALFGVLMLAGCASVPEPIDVGENQPLIDYSAVASNAAAHQNKMARWGGEIAEVTNLKDRTRIEMVHYPISDSARPQDDEESQGRFRVYVNGFLDPMVFKQGKSLTVLGTVTGAEAGSVGEHQYTFPTLDGKGYYLWKPRREVESTTISVWGGHGWHGWHWWPYSHRRHVVIHQRSGSSKGGEGKRVESQPKNVSPRIRPNRPEGKQVRPINTRRQSIEHQN